MARKPSTDAQVGKVDDDKPDEAKQTDIHPDVPQDDLEVVVLGPKTGRRRAGRRFGPEPTVIPLSELNEADKAVLIADPKLSVMTRAVAISAEE